MNFNQLAAAGTVNLGPLSSAINYFIIFVDRFLVPLIFALAFLAFLWGVYTYFIAGAADVEKQKKGRDFVLYSIIGFVLMLSVWGIVNIVTGTLGFGGRTRPALPLFGGSASTNTTTNSNTKANNFIDCLAIEGAVWDDKANGGAGSCSK